MKLNISCHSNNQNDITSDEFIGDDGELFLKNWNDVIWCG